ncbi:Rho GTPase activating protein, partial [Coemansia guatemalensis]
MWPATGSLDNVGALSSGGSDAAANAADGEPKSDAAMDQQYNLTRASGRPRSVSLPPAQDGSDQASSASKQARPDAGAAPTRPSPAAIASTLSTSFTGYNESLSDQTEDISIHYMPSDISTIESSIYSSYNGNSSGSRHNDISSRSIGDRNSYASMPDSPVSPTRPTGPAVRAANSDLVAADLPLAGAYSGAHTPSTDSNGIGRAAGTAHGHRLIGDPVKQMRQPAAGMAKSQFTKNAVGRIVHEEERAPDLPAVTPHVTDDILGVGRQETGRDDGRAANAGAPARTREDKKRGRITFMWGKRKPTEAEPPVPEFDLSGGGSPGSDQAASTPSPAAVTAPRRLRRGSISGEHRHGASKNSSFKGPVFGQPLERTVELTRIREHYQLPSIVYRCIEYLDAKMAWLEEGIYRQSGSSLALTQLRKEFNTNRDYNLLKLSKPPDIHAVASLLKAYLRELPENVLTARLYQEFVRVVDLAERHDRVHELGRLVSELPLANYTLLRALTAHLIRIVQKASTNRMTLRNIGIVFSPSLGIPV